MARLPRGITSAIREGVDDLLGEIQRQYKFATTPTTPGQRKIDMPGVHAGRKTRAATEAKGRVFRNTTLAATAAAGVREALRDEDPDKIDDALIRKLAKQVLKEEGVPLPRGRPKAPIPKAKDINLEIANNAKKDIENYYEDKRKNKMALGGMATPSATPPRVSNPARGVAPVSRDLERPTPTSPARGVAPVSRPARGVAPVSRDLERPTPTSPARRRGPVSRPAVMPTSPIEEYNPRVSNPAKGVAPVSRDLERPTPTSPARRRGPVSRPAVMPRKPAKGKGPVVRPAVMPRKPAEGKGPVVRPAVMPRKPAKGKGPVVRPAVMPTPAKGAAPTAGTLAAATKAARAMQKSKGTAPVSRPAVMSRKPLDVKKQRALANATRFAGSALLGKTR